MKFNFKDYGNGVKTYIIGDKWVATYKGDVWGIGDSENDAMVDASQRWEKNKDYLELDETPFDVIKGKWRSEEITPVSVEGSVEIYAIPPLYFGIKDGKLVGYGTTMESAFYNNEEIPLDNEMMWW